MMSFLLFLSLISLLLLSISAILLGVERGSVVENDRDKVIVENILKMTYFRTIGILRNKSSQDVPNSFKILNNGFICNKSGFEVETLATPAAKPICSSFVSTFQRTDKAFNDRKIETNVLRSKEEEREQILFSSTGNDRGKSSGVTFSLPKEPVSATRAPTINK